MGIEDVKAKCDALGNQLEQFSQGEKEKSVIAPSRASSPLNALAGELSGRELDALIADRVMNLVPCDGWVSMNFGSAGGAALRKECAHGDKECYPTSSVGSVQGTYDGVPPYSRKIWAAMEVVEKMRANGWEVQISSDDENPTWQAVFDSRGAAGKLLLGEFESDCLAEAICCAALAAVENNSESKTVSAHIAGGKG